MIKVEHLKVWGFDHAIRGARNPMNSWDRMDSYGTEQYIDSKFDFEIGPNDMKLLQNLFKASLDNNFAHRKFMRQIFIAMDVTAPRYWWPEADQYKVGTVTDSCSTMHKIHAKEFTLDDFSHDYITAARKEEVLQHKIDELNEYRLEYLESSEGYDKLMFWHLLIEFLPQSYLQKRTLTMNYEVAVTMIKQRENHKLNEWREFVSILKGLPFLKEITGIS